MWPSLERTRRLLRRDAGSTPTDHRVVVGADPSPLDDVVIAMGRTELERLGAALQSLLGPGTSRPDTPVRLQAAISAAIARYGAAESRVRVDRRPAGLYTPEAWQLRLSGVDPRVCDVIRGAIRDGVFTR